MEELEEYFEQEQYIDEAGGFTGSTTQNPNKGGFLSGIGGFLPTIFFPAPVPPATIPNSQGNKIETGETIAIIVLLGALISFVVIAFTLRKKR